MWLKDNGLRWPLQPVGYRRDRLPEITWVEPTYHAVHTTLTHPAYAGAYVYGHTKTDRYLGDDGRLRVRRRKLPQDQWEVVIAGHHSGFIRYIALKPNVVVEIAPAFEGALQDRLADPAEKMADDIAYQTVSCGIVEYVACPGFRLGSNRRRRRAMCRRCGPCRRRCASLRSGRGVGAGGGPALRIRRVRRIGDHPVAHRAVLAVAVHQRDRCVHWQLVVVRADPGTMGVRVGEHPAQQHLVGLGPMPGTRLLGLTANCSMWEW